MTRCLVTGANGFLGRNLANGLLAAGHCVSVITRAKAEVGSGVEENIVCDIRDQKSLGAILSKKEFDFVFHCAAHIPLTQDAPGECLETNSLGTYNLLLALKEAGVRRFVYSSSMEVYGNIQEKIPIGEDARCLPTNAYGLSKLFGETACMLFRGFFDISILRYSGIFGAGKRRGLVYNAITSLKKGVPVRINGNGQQSNDYVWVNDVVRANLLCLKLKEKYGVYNIGGGKELKAVEVVQTVSGLLERPGEMTIETPDSGGQSRFCLDIEKARHKLGYQPMDFKKAVAAFCEGL